MSHDKGSMCDYYPQTVVGDFRGVWLNRVRLALVAPVGEFAGVATAVVNSTGCHCEQVSILKTGYRITNRLRGLVNQLVPRSESA